VNLGYQHFETDKGGDVDAQGRIREPFMDSGFYDSEGGTANEAK